MQEQKTYDSDIKLLHSEGLKFLMFIAGDDVKEKKPDPSIYIAAAKVDQCNRLISSACFLAVSFYLSRDE